MNTQETTTAKTQRSKTKAPQASKAKSKTAKAAKRVKSPKRTKPQQGAARSGSKTTVVLDLMRRKEGATLAEIAKATGWQDHSIRGFVSGHVIKKMGLRVESTKNDLGERTYRIVT